MNWTLTNNITSLTLTPDTGETNEAIELMASNIITYHSYGSTLFIVFKYKEELPNTTGNIFTAISQGNVFGTNTLALKYTEVTDPSTSSAFTSLAGLVSYFVSWYGSAAPAGSASVSASALASMANHFSPDDFTATYTSSSTITLSGLSFTPTNEQIKFISVKASSDEVTHYVAGINGVYFEISSNVITIHGAGTPFASGDLYTIGILSQDKAYDLSTDTEKNTIQNPEWAHYTDVEHPVDETDLANGTYYQVFDLDGYRNYIIQVLGSGGVTFTVYATLNEDASDTDETDAGWEDVTNDHFGASSIVDDLGTAVIDTPTMFKKVMVKYVTSDATNAVDIWFRKY